MVYASRHGHIFVDPATRPRPESPHTAAGGKVGLWQYTSGWGRPNKIRARQTKARSIGASLSPNFVGLPQLSPQCKQGNKPLPESCEFPPSVEFLLGSPSRHSPGQSPSKRHHRMSVLCSGPMLPEIDSSWQPVHVDEGVRRRSSSCTPGDQVVSQISSSRRRHSFGGLAVSSLERPPTADESNSREEAPAPSFKGSGALAQALVNQCGSLERAFCTFDYNKKGKITRSQWETGLALLRVDCEEHCGISSRSFFKMMDSKQKWEVTLDAWTKFFSRLEGTDAATLLTEDHGPREPPKKNRWSRKRASIGCCRELDNEDSNIDDAFLGPGGSAGDMSVGSSGNFDAHRQLHRRSAAAVLSPSRRRHIVEPYADMAHGPGQAGMSGLAIASECQADSEVGNAAQRQAQRPHLRLARSLHEGADCGEDVCLQGSPSVQSRSQGNLDIPFLGARGYPANDDETPPSCRPWSTQSSPRQDAAIAGLTGPHADPLSARRPFTGNSCCDLRSFNADELDALAEQQQLNEELGLHSLNGVQALAYVLIAKLQSFKKAFKWFDVNRQGNLAPVSWETGIRLLKINMFKLTGLNAMDIFGMMDRKPRNGSVTWKEFKHFFASVNCGEFTPLLEEAKGLDRGSSLAERSAKKKHALRQLQAKQLGKLGADLQASSAPPEACVQTGSILSSVADGRAVQGSSESSGNLSQDQHGHKMRRQRTSKGQTTGKSTFEQLDQSAIDEKESSNDTLLSGKHGQLDDGSGSSDSGDEIDAGQLDESMASSVTNSEDDEPLVGGYEQTYRQRIRNELRRLGPGEYLEYTVGSDSLECSIIEEVAEELGLWSHTAEELPVPLSARGGFKRNDSGEWPGAIFVGNLFKFAQQTREQLLAIEAGEHLEFSSSLSEAQRRVVHMLAAGLGLWTHSEGKGAQRRVVAFNLGAFADEIRQELDALQPGQSKAFPEHFSVAQQRLIHVIAREMGFWVDSPQSESGCCLEVFNFRDFTEDSRKQLLAFSAGEQHDFSPELSEQQRKIVHSIANELDLVSLSHDEDSARLVSVAHLRDFRNEVRMMLKRLQPGQRRDFQASLTMLQRNVVQDVAADMGLEAELHFRLEGTCCYVSVTRPGQAGTSDTEAAHAPQKLLKHHATVAESDEMDTKEAAAVNQGVGWSHCKEGETEASVIYKIFQAYATGRFNGEAIFLRFPDLNEFAEDAKDAMPSKHRLFLRFRADLESVFDDTMQLQVDMGTRTTKGLTLQWFQVFIQKAMKKVGLGCVGLLFALIAEI